MQEKLAKLPRAAVISVYDREFDEEANYGMISDYLIEEARDE